MIRNQLYVQVRVAKCPRPLMCASRLAQREFTDGAPHRRAVVTERRKVVGGEGLEPPTSSV